MTTIGVIGCGMIGGAYLPTLQAFEHLDVVACADVLPESAQHFATAHNISRTCTPEELLCDPEIEVVLNLTPASQHAAVNRAVAESRKALYSEKPLATDLVDALELVGLAEQTGLRVGCAPDTFMGAGLQTAQAAVENGVIGEPVGATAFVMGQGPEAWHPNAGIFYERGAGPLYDMGPYYLTALIQLLGPARRISAIGRRSTSTRAFGAGKQVGELISVEVPTHVSATIEFQSGSIATLVTSFDVPATRHRWIEIYGTEGTLAVPDPNDFAGKVAVRRADEAQWTELPLRRATIPQQRGIGLADMAWAMRSGRPHRASLSQAVHVVDMMASAISSSEQYVVVELVTTCDRPKLVPEGLSPNTFDS